ncbi:MAG: hypothetical protein M3Q64_01325 [bacterium]|nr:hypothetical protein [bacterium]
MAKSQLNQLSKRQILESLMQEQNQSNVTLSRLITAVARTAEIDPVKLAEFFIDDKGNQEFVEKFNVAVKERHVSNHAAEQAVAAAAPEATPGDNAETETEPSKQA